jgi:hypothetical protein
MKTILFLIVLFFATPAFGQDPSCGGALNVVMQCATNGGFGALTHFSWSLLASIGTAFLVAATVSLRLLAEILGFIANKTKNSWDNKLVQGIMSAVNLLAKIIGYFGVGKAIMVK